MAAPMNWQQNTRTQRQNYRGNIAENNVNRPFRPRHPGQISENQSHYNIRFNRNSEMQFANQERIPVHRNRMMHSHNQVAHFPNQSNFSNSQQPGDYTNNERFIAQNFQTRTPRGPLPFPQPPNNSGGEQDVAQYPSNSRLPFPPQHQEPPIQNISMQQHLPQQDNFHGHDLNREGFVDNSLNTDQFKQVKSSLKEGREMDQKWLNGWVAKRKKHLPIKSDATFKPLKISDAEEKTRQMIVLLAKLQKNKQQLETMKHEDKTIWDQKLKEVEQIKSELEVLHKELTNEETVAALGRKIAERKFKRERLKQTRHQMYLEHQQELEARAQKHQEIDTALQLIIQKQMEAKQEADMQREGDQILGEVRKKISEARKAAQLLQGVQKLRKLRHDRLERQGVLNMCEAPGTSTTKQLMFEAKVGNLQQLLSNQLVTYRSEEEALKVILESEQEETREKEREMQKKRKIELQERQKRKEEQILFGNQNEPLPDDPIYPFWRYYNVAEDSLEALISVRRDWDLHLVLPDTPGASCIPSGCVVPVEPGSEAWTSALVNTTSS